MAVYQAAAAFEIFTGRKADRARMLESFGQRQYR
jgi:shikimate 5-dehydrogenase